MKNLLTLFFFIILTPSFSQNKLETGVCEKCYLSEDGIPFSDTARSLFRNQYDPMFTECSWFCCLYISNLNRISASPDMSDSLTDHSITSCCLINRPVKTEILYEVYLNKSPGHLRFEEDSVALPMPQEEYDQLYVSGFLIANGNRNSKKEYFEYGRLKKISIRIDGKNIGSITLKDTPKTQHVYFGEFYKLHYDLKVQIVVQIEEIYPGSKYKELAISELQLDGSGGHSITDNFCWQK